MAIQPDPIALWPDATSFVAAATISSLLFVLVRRAWSCWPLGFALIERKSDDRRQG